ncbi:hypothetical protein ADUPG1_010238 [Aduncisulcus paluster]|uniref:EGF-like domain-containing protein n=2 Tax=Aduncisulcus paluster TaxID=2918883 RepID=A0ABQ5JTM2_9EUKA|nr:hypothetical protein ADUPG1_010238 [Aduncisulcus paluster]
MSETVCTDDNECSLVCHSIHDSNLRDALCLEFELDAGCFLSIPQLRSYDKTTIDLHGLGISKLRGIEFLGCGNVTSIDLSSNDISDYSTLLFMAGLTSIELSNNPICSSSSGDVGAFFQSEYVAYHNIDDPDSVTVNADNMTCSSCRSDEEIYPDYVEANTVCYGDIVGCRYGYMMVYQDDSTALECMKDDSGICSTCDNVNMACSLSLYEQDLTTELVPTCICATNDGSACGNAGICDWAEQLCTCESDAYYDTENLYCIASTNCSGCVVGQGECILVEIEEETEIITLVPQCVCDDGYFGSMCSFLCPVSLYDGVEYACGGNGTCDEVSHDCSCDIHAYLDENTLSCDCEEKYTGLGCTEKVLSPFLWFLLVIPIAAIIIVIVMCSMRKKLSSIGEVLNEEPASVPLPSDDGKGILDSDNYIEIESDHVDKEFPQADEDILL